MAQLLGDCGELGRVRKSRSDLGQPGAVQHLNGGRHGICGLGRGHDDRAVQQRIAGFVERK